MKEKDYILNVRLGGEVKKPLTKLAKRNGRSINGEIKFAVNKHLNREGMAPFPHFEDGILRIADPKIAKSLSNHPKCKK